MTEQDELIATLEALGAKEVRTKFALHAYGVPTDSGWRVSAVKGWLDEKDREAASLAEHSRAAREEEALSIARDNAASARDSAASARASSASAANSAASARAQLRWAMWAAIIAVIAAAIAIKDQIIAVIFG